MSQHFDIVNINCLTQPVETVRNPCFCLAFSYSCKPYYHPYNYSLLLAQVSSSVSSVSVSIVLQMNLITVVQIHSTFISMQGQNIDVPSSQMYWQLLTSKSLRYLKIYVYTLFPFIVGLVT